jgi:hypothetical protein
MGTRGFVGFVIDGIEKIAYNHCDSYPEGLGVDTLSWLHAAVKDLVDLAERARALRVVDPQSQPSDEDIDQLRAYYRADVGGRSERPTWYQILRDTQGNPGLMLAAGVIEDASLFPADSLFAEWGYIVDLDAGVFEVYRGFQSSPHDKGRFAALPRPRQGRNADKYYPVALVASWPLAEIPDEKDFCEKYGFAAVDAD